MDDCDNVAPALPPGAGQIFMPRTQRQALAELVRAILAGEPFVALTGKPGVGKTTVLNTAVAVLAERGLRIRRIDNPHGTPLRLPQMIGELLGNAPGTVTNEDIERLFDALTLSNNGGQLVLVFDDAHYLQPDVLGYLQIVSSLHALGIRNQQVIFGGRPEFWGLLEDPKLCDLHERIKARLVIEPLGEAEARDFLYYRLEQMYGAIRQHVPDAALSRLVHHGDGIPGRLDPILLKSLVAAGGYRLLGPETVDAGAYAVASGAPSVVVPAAPEESSGQIVAPHPLPATMPKIPERRHRVLHSGALVCLAVLLAGSIGTVWHSSVQPNSREIGGPTTAASATLPEPPTQTAIMLAASTASPPEASVTSQAGPTGTLAPPLPAPATSSRVDTPIVTVATAPLPVAQQQAVGASALDTPVPVTAANQAVSPAAESSSAGAATGSGQDMSSPPRRGGDAVTVPDATSPAQGPSRSDEADARLEQPQNAPTSPTASPPAAVAPPLPAATAVSQPPPAAAALAVPQPAAASPPATDATAPSAQPPAASVAPPASTTAAVATQTTEPTDSQAQAPNAPPPSATTPSAAVSSPSTGAIPQSAQSEPTPAAPAASPEVPISPAVTAPTVLATQRSIVSQPIARSAQPEPPKTEATAPAAPSPAVSITPAHLETSAPPAAGTPAPPAPSPAPLLQTAPTDIQTAPQPASLPPGIVADLIRRGDAMLAIGDVSSARLLYSPAAESGDARATTQLAKTYDPLFLTKIGAWGIPTDATTAAKLYRRAAALGDAEATERLKRLAEAGQ